MQFNLFQSDNKINGRNEDKFSKLCTKHIFIFIFIKSRGIPTPKNILLLEHKFILQFCHQTQILQILSVELDAITIKWFELPNDSCT